MKGDEHRKNAGMKLTILCNSKPLPLIQLYLQKQHSSDSSNICNNCVQCKPCESVFKTISAENVDEKVIHEIIQTIRFPEILTNINKLADEHAEISKQNLILALKNLTELWTYLYPTEQQKVVSRLTDEVVVGDDGIRIQLNLNEFVRMMVFQVESMRKITFSQTHLQTMVTHTHL